MLVTYNRARAGAPEPLPEPPPVEVVVAPQADPTAITGSLPEGMALRDVLAQRYRGSRYSFGYPACPDLADQAKLDRLMGFHRVGVRLTENFQLEPEHATSALVVHHPEARYFSVD